jgi:hypothetical protein
MSLADARTWGRQMGIFSYSRALGVAVMTCGMVSFAPASDLAAGTLLSPGSAALIRKSAEPFGIFAFRLSGGGLSEKWLGVQRKLDDEQVQLALLRQGSETLRIACGASISRHRGQCESPRGTRSDRRDQPRHQSRNPPNERSGPIWRN